MDPCSSPLPPGRETTLDNEFASVSVKLIARLGRPYLRITDLSSGRAAELDPADAFFTSGQTMTPSGDVALDVTVEIDTAANGPRLKVARKMGGSCVYLDPLELSDAAVTGAWAKLPPAYDARLGAG